MTLNTQEMKALALACDPAKCADEAEEGRRLAEFYDECDPEEILALLAEIERLESDLQDASSEVHGLSIQAGKRKLDFTHVIHELDQLKAEKAALRKDAERYRGVRRVANRQGHTDEQFDQQTDSRVATFDAAMAKGPGHD